MKVFAFVALIACIAVLAVVTTHQRASAAGQYESPCLVSWDENDGDSTLCVLTGKAAYMEHTLGRAH